MSDQRAGVNEPSSTEDRPASTDEAGPRGDTQPWTPDPGRTEERPDDDGQGPTRADPGPTRADGGEALGGEALGLEAGCRYRIVGFHDGGGLGEIYLADDLELGRQVALKEIRRRHASDPQARARFVQEAEVIGKLEHPGIVPIYGLGRRGDGRPYYAMRFIRGETLRVAIDRLHDGRAGRPRGEHELMFRGLLGRFVAACNAIDYAHGRGVIHRDLKPANIMLGPHGETLVVDWGLTKVVGQDREGDPSDAPRRARGGEGVEPTAADKAMGTWRYMSPEQAAGRHDLVGPASDVFGLGATLYCLLTGKAPYAGTDLEKVKEHARSGEIPPAGRVARDVPAPLASICRKATEADPARRYASPRALADDVERWLADEPVLAHRDRAPARIARWARHHRPQVAALLALAATFLIASASLLEVRAARARANENFRIALDAVDQMLGRVSEEDLRATPRMSEVRAKLGDDAVRFLGKLLEQHPDDSVLRWRYADLCTRAANYHLLAGRVAAFDEYYDRIFSVYRGLIADYPNKPGYVNALAWAEVAQAQVRQQSGEVRRAIGQFRVALDRAGRLVRADPGSENFRHTLARTRMYLADALASAGEYPEAREQADLAIEALGRLAAEDGANLEYRLHLVQVLCGRGTVAAESGDGLAAGRLFDRAQAELDRAVVPEADRVGMLYQRAYLLRERGRWLALDARTLEDAARAHDEVARLMAPLCVDLPDVRDHHVERAWALLNRGKARGGLGVEKRAGAMADFEDALVILRRWAEKDPTLALIRSLKGQALGAQGRLRLEAGEVDRAIPLLDEAITLQKQCLAENQGSPMDRKALGEHRRLRQLAGQGPRPAPAR